MTAITALISKKWIACASDSLLTELNPVTKNVKHIEFKKSKIVYIRRFKALASYWGLAKVGNWRAYEFLEMMASKADLYEDLESFANAIRNELSSKLDSFSFKNPLDKGIGIHLVGFEKINNLELPELFLICNYGKNYQSITELFLTRHLYNNLPPTFKKDNLTFDEQREQIKIYLDNDDNRFIFNNGDPFMFNPAANAILSLFQISKVFNNLKEEENHKINMKIVSLALNVVKDFQKTFFKKSSIRVGGKIHRVLITSQGKLYTETD